MNADVEAIATEMVRCQNHLKESEINLITVQRVREAAADCYVVDVTIEHKAKAAPGQGGSLFGGVLMRVDVRIPKAYVDDPLWRRKWLAGLVRAGVPWAADYTDDLEALLE
jgi:hypothetical protein